MLKEEMEDAIEQVNSEIEELRKEFYHFAKGIGWLVIFFILGIIFICIKI